MGFILMIAAAVLGVILVIQGCSHLEGKARKLGAIVVGIIFIAIAVWLGWPK